MLEFLAVLISAITSVVILLWKLSTFNKCMSVKFDHLKEDVNEIKEDLKEVKTEINSMGKDVSKIDRDVKILENAYK